MAPFGAGGGTDVTVGKRQRCSVRTPVSVLTDDDSRSRRALLTVWHEAHCDWAPAVHGKALELSGVLAFFRWMKHYSVEAVRSGRGDRVERRAASPEPLMLESFHAKPPRVNQAWSLPSPESPAKSWRFRKS
jgi:hypothetical protein